MSFFSAFYKIDYKSSILFYLILWSIIYLVLNAVNLTLCLLIFSSIEVKVWWYNGLYSFYLISLLISVILSSLTIVLNTFEATWVWLTLNYLPFYDYSSKFIVQLDWVWFKFILLLFKKKWESFLSFIFRIFRSSLLG